MTLKGLKELVMTGITGHCWKWHRMAGNGWNGWEWLEMAGDGCSGWRWIKKYKKKTGFSWKAEMAGNCLKLLDMAGN